MNEKQEKARDRELERLTRESTKARCVVCGERVGLEDRCNDGTYLHRACARGHEVRPT